MEYRQLGNSGFKVPELTLGTEAFAGRGCFFREWGNTDAQGASRLVDVATVIIGARNEARLRDNLGAIGWSLTPEQVAKLDAASARPRTYPHWRPSGFQERNPLPTPSLKPAADSAGPGDLRVD